MRKKFARITFACWLGAFATSQLSGQTPLLKFAFNDGGTTTTDVVSGVVLNLSSNSLPLDFHAAAGSGPGNIGGSLYFPGTYGVNGGAIAQSQGGNGVNLGTISNFTVCFWLKPTATLQTANFERFLVIGTNGTTDFQVANSLGVCNNGNRAGGGLTNSIEPTLNTQNPDVTTFGVAPIPINIWSFLALTYDGTNLRYYVGTETSSVQLISTAAIAGQTVRLGTNWNIFLGNRSASSGNRAYKGYMADVRFYTGAGDSSFVENVRASAFPQASPYTNSVTGNWSASSSWMSLAPPMGGASNAAIILKPSSALLAATNNMVGIFNLNQLKALPGAASLYGNSILFTINAGNLPTVANGSGNPLNLYTPIILSANTSISAGNGITIYGAISGSASLTVVGGGTLALANTNFYTGDTIVNGGELRLDVPGSIYASAYNSTAIVTIANNGVLDFDDWGYGSANSFGNLDYGSARIVVNGGTLRCVAPNGTSQPRGCTIGTAGGTLDSSGSGWTIAYNASYPSLALNGVMTLTGAGNGEIDKNIIGTGGLFVNGAGVWTLTGINTFSGLTTISTGTLALGGGGSLANTPLISLTSGARFDVSGLVSPFTLQNGQTLSNNAASTGSPQYSTINGNLVISSGGSLVSGTCGGFLKLNGSLTLSNGSAVAFTLNRTMATNALVSGINSLTCGGTLSVSSVGTGYQVGDSFKLFDAVHYGGSFSKVTMTPASPAPGLAWDTSLIGLGVLKVVAGSPQTATAAIFGHNMVLQRGKSVPIWGTADPGRTITVSFGGQNKTIMTGLDGRWLVRLDPMVANATPQNLTVTGYSQVVWTNVLVGEVWLGSGQSNMAFPMTATSGQYGTLGALNYSNEIAAANFPLIRFAAVFNNPSLTAVPDLSWAPGWQVCSSNTVGNFSAVAYFFGRQLQQNLNVPIGLVVSAVGGTPAEAWTSQDAMNAIPELKQLAAQELVQYNNGLVGIQTAPSALFNSLIQPLIPYAFRGVIWYQGEANANSAAQGDQYRVLLPTLIADWRNHWQQDKLSFYFVQLASCNYPYLPYVREAQALTLQTATNTGMALAIDIGPPTSDAANPHPQDKQDVGTRLALWALTNDYGQSVVCSGPLFKSCVIETNQIRLFFDYAQSGLMVGQKTNLNPVLEVVGGTLTGFEIAGTNGQYVSANAHIDGSTVVVASPSVPNPVTARFAWTGYATNFNFYNRAGLPASPFRTWSDTNRPLSLRISLSNSTANLSFVVPCGLTCWVESKDTLSAAAWNPLTLPQTATGSLLSQSDALNGLTQRFYQVAQVPP